MQVFATEAFLAGYEATALPVAEGFGYNWDRPCTFVGDRTFVTAHDDNRQLAFYDIPGLPSADEFLKPTRLVECDVFRLNEHGEAKGELHHDTESGHLVALTPDDGVFVVALDGTVVAHMPDLGGWAYSWGHRVFHRWNDGIEERALPVPGRVARSG